MLTETRVDTVHNKAPVYLKTNSISICICDQYRNTRSANSLNSRLPSSKLCQDQTLYYNAMKDWNDLPTNIKLLQTKESFN